ncbi:putative TRANSMEMBRANE PROTEIN [Dehalococcoides mccartyi]|nr:putative TRANSMEMBRANE PROTEIN [Dehalococcoides mccartyi]
MPLFKWFLAIPHYILLAFLGFAAFICTIFAWFTIVFTGKYPKSLFDFVVGVLRWGLRVSAYSSLLITDIYPPFSLEP